MCLAIPAKIEKIDDDNMALVDILGTKRECSLDLTPDAKLGDYVLVHAGFSISVVSLDEAEMTLSMIREMPELADLTKA